MPIGRQITTRLQPHIQKVLDLHLPRKDQTLLLRSLIILACDAITRDPYVISEIITGAVRTNEFEMKIHRRTDNENI